MPKEFPVSPAVSNAPPAGAGLTDAERAEIARHRAEASEKWRAYVESGALLHRLRAEYLEKQFLLAMQRDRRAGVEIRNLNYIIKDWADRYELLERRHANLLSLYNALENKHNQLASAYECLEQRHEELLGQLDILSREHAELLRQCEQLVNELDRLAGLGWWRGLAHISRQRLRRSPLGPALRAIKRRLLPTVEATAEPEPARAAEAHQAPQTEVQTDTRVPEAADTQGAVNEVVHEVVKDVVNEVVQEVAKDAVNEAVEAGEGGGEPDEIALEEARVPAVRLEPGGRVASPELQTILLLAVHAEDTPLARYSLDVLDALAARFNVLIWHLDEGRMVDEYRKAATGFLQHTESRSDYGVARKVVNDLLDQHPDIEFAVVIGGELKCPLPALGERHVPIIGLVDESVASASSFYAFEEILFWHTHTFFTSPTAKKLMQRAYPYANAAAFSVLVPGPGARTLPRFTDAPPPDARLPPALRPDPDAPIDAVVLGWGPVTPESGVDLFVACADEISRRVAGKRYRFAWLAQRGPASPTTDPTSYSVAVHAQIEALGLQELVSIIYEPLSDEVHAASAALVLDTSRCERLQHSPVGALERGIPVVAFAGQTRVAEEMQRHGLEGVCLARPGRVAELAEKALALLADEPMRHRVASQVKNVDWSACTIEGYVRSIAESVEAIRQEGEQERVDEAFLRETGQLQAEYIGYMVDHAEELECDTARLYVRGWRAGMGARKPRPGFQPQVYAQAALPAGSTEDPFAHYLRAGQPAGAWNHPSVRPLTGRADAEPMVQKAATLRTALHIHAYYPDMLDDLLARISCNRTRPDLFISVKDAAAKVDVAERLGGYAGRVVALEIVPNRGRDIGPFLSTFGAGLVNEYEVIGHMHTKGSHHAVKHIVDRWRQFLLENLLGGEQSGNMMDSILAQMADNPEWGIVFADDPIPLGWDGNRECAEALAAHLKVDTLPERFCFPVGTMFWIRAAALKPFVDLGLGYEDYPAEPLPVDGTLLHALERLFGVVPRAHGLECALTTVPGVSR